MPESIAAPVAFTLVSLFLGASQLSGQQSSPARPNVVLVMTDDQGIGDFGFQGNLILETPNLDAMAARSARMANFYVSPVCTPTRAGAGEALIHRSWEASVADVSEHTFDDVRLPVGTGKLKVVLKDDAGDLGAYQVEIRWIGN